MQASHPFRPVQRVFWIIRPIPICRIGWKALQLNALLWIFWVACWFRWPKIWIRVLTLRYNGRDLGASFRFSHLVLRRIMMTCNMKNCSQRIWRRSLLFMLVPAFQMIFRTLAVLLLTGRHIFGDWCQPIKQSALNTPMDMYACKSSDYWSGVNRSSSQHWTRQWICMPVNHQITDLVDQRLWSQIIRLLIRDIDLGWDISHVLVTVIPLHR